VFERQSKPKTMRMQIMQGFVRQLVQELSVYTAPNSGCGNRFHPDIKAEQTRIPTIFNARLLLVAAAAAQLQNDLEGFRL
jgi:hypothetical protein